MKLSVETWKGKRYYVLRGGGIFGRKRLSNFEKNNESIKELMLKSFRLYNQGKTKNYIIKYKNRKIIAHKSSENFGMITEMNFKEPKSEKQSFSVQHLLYIYLKLEDNREYKGWGRSTIHYCRNAVDWDRNIRERANTEAFRQFLAEKEVPYEIPTEEIKILKRRYLKYL